ncbi:uncharacterized protein B0H18DRAFT_894788 [Fomitopsis serialis]|uniref:uncharacterized protein n=1 Tax=Fomitopsis serialis TaxID=139415 RepID=UPI0020082462|nr:uncharacterized protein B0H18DRAFT_894788 [Neoantrodia serialis]KAH9910674.1 hypothetical protein B0H18DRAFT_894788 [Neoantrodia serialis]
MPKRKRTFEELLNDTCGACHQPFKTTQGLCAHQSMSKKCSWYKKGKLKALTVGTSSPRDNDGHPRHPPDYSHEEDEEDDGNGEGEDDELDSLFDFIEVCAPSKRPVDPGGNADAPGPSTAGPSTASTLNARRTALSLDDDDDERVVDEDEEAGTKNPWAPFESEMDWRFASWAIQEGLTLGSIDRALEIPGFQERLGLSYHNSRSLLQRVDSLPDRAEWMERCLSFKDRPNEKHLLQFRDIIQAIRTLLGNPEHADHIVYRPRRIFSDASRTHRLYNKMWTGCWWHAVQVSGQHQFAYTDC